MNKRMTAAVAAVLIGGGASLLGPSAASADGAGGADGASSGVAPADHPSGPSADEPSEEEIGARLAQLNAGLSDEQLADH